MKRIEKVVAENVKKLIKEYNLTHQDLATIAGVSVSTVGKWMLEKATPRMGAIQKISDHFNIPKSYILKEESYELPVLNNKYNFFPAHVSAGLPNEVDGITQTEKISISDKIMGKYAGNKDIYITKINGDSMNKVIPDNSLIAVRPVSLENLKDGDIVVYSKNGEYAVKRYFNFGDEVEFRPDSYDKSFRVDTIQLDNDIDLKIKGKVVLYIVELD